MEKHKAIPKGYMTVGEMAKKAGVTIRTLQYYDKEGLLSPSAASEGRFRLYTVYEMERLWRILLLKEFGYELKDIKAIIDNPNYDMRGSLGERINSLEKKKERLENLIGFAKMIKMTGTIPLSFEEFGDTTFDEFLQESQKYWSMNMFANRSDEENNPEYKLMQKIQIANDMILNQPEKEWTDDEAYDILESITNVVDFDMFIVFTECISGFADFLGEEVCSEDVQAHVNELYELINKMYGRYMSINGFSLYGQMYGLEGDIGLVNAKNLGEDVSVFISQAIQAYCENARIRKNEEDKNAKSN